MLPASILFFLKYPQLGRVKTRLARSVGDEQAMEAFHWMVYECWTRAKDVTAERQVYGAPEYRMDAFDEWLTGGLPATPQPSGSLGDRLIAGVEHAFARGHSKVICVGGDCPSLSKKEYEQALEALDTHDLAIYPAEDGGYVLIGLKAPNKQLFQNIFYDKLANHNRSPVAARAWPPRCPGWCRSPRR